MRRGIFAAIIAIVALAVGLAPVATAGDGTVAQSSAKKKGKAKGKGKNCKAKKGKAKGKAKKSATASAKKKAKGKGKKKNCKPKPKKPGAKKPAPKGPVGPPPPASDWPLTDGVYDDLAGKIDLKLTKGATEAEIQFSGDGARTCIPIPVALGAGQVTSTASLFTASADLTGKSKAFTELSWSITINPDLTYKAVISSAFEFPEQTPCKKPGVEYTGKFTKVVG